MMIDGRPEALCAAAAAQRRRARTPTDIEIGVFAIAFGISVGYATMLTIGFWQHLWIVDAAGHPVVNDFVVFWAVGHLAIKGLVFAAYDAHLEHAAELATIGHNFHELLGWSYPPLFLFVVMLPSYLPYIPAFILWGATTLILYACTVAAIADRRIALMVACAMPWVLVELILGQNGFLTSAVIGVALLLLEKRPALSGLVLGFLSYKPQFAVLFPLALAAGGYWRAFGWAALGTLVWNGLAGAVFGFGTYTAFLHALRVAADNHLVHSDLGWRKLQSFYGVMRSFGASADAAWSTQAAASVSIALGIVMGWRSRNIPFPLKAALLATAVLLVTPYVLYYDVPVLAIALAFLFRHRGFDKIELVLFAVAAPFLFAPLTSSLPSCGALLASLVVGAVTLRRCYSALALTRISPSCATDATSVPSSA